MRRRLVHHVLHYVFEVVRIDGYRKIEVAGIDDDREDNDEDDYDDDDNDNDDGGNDDDDTKNNDDNGDDEQKSFIQIQTQNSPKKIKKRKVKRKSKND